MSKEGGYGSGNDGPGTVNANNTVVEMKSVVAE